MASWGAPRRQAGVAFVLLLMLAAWLRWPTVDFRMWNVDEAIHASAARTLLDGGVLYRDAIDQRTPLTYYLTAALFAVTGENNVRAMHLLVVALVALTATGLFVLGRRWPGIMAGGIAALLYVILSATMLFRGDAYAFSTEWCVALFTVGAAVVFQSVPERLPTLVLTGILLGLAFLSKQPALLDVAPAVLVILVDSATRRGRQLAALGAGFLLPVGGSVLYFAVKGALGDFIFYAWTYNLRYYGPEISLSDRLRTAGRPFTLLASQHPVILAAVVVFGLSILAMTLRRGRPAARDPGHRAMLYLLVWTVSALAGAASSGRDFDHYSIQVLPAFCLLGGGGLAAAANWGFTRRRRWLAAIAGTLVLAIAFVDLAAGIRRARLNATQPVDPSLRAGEFIRRHTQPDEKIFVWGFHSDLYVFADRKPASRFLYASFLTGLVPWTNIAPEKDTTYAVVPGTMDQLLADLEASRPAFIVDCSAGPNRHWYKYPLEKFPALHAFVQSHYLQIEPSQFGQQGFRLFIIRDSFRRRPRVLQDMPATATPDAPLLQLLPGVGRRPARALFAASAPDGRLQRLELLADGEVLGAATFSPAPGMLLECPLPPEMTAHRFAVRALSASGATVTSAAQLFDPRPATLPPGRLPEFSLQGSTPLAPEVVQYSYSAVAEKTPTEPVFQMHAPAYLAYRLPAGGGILSGEFGLASGAYAPDNPTPTDGADFLIEYTPDGGTSVVLLRQTLRPKQFPSDGGPQGFKLKIPNDGHPGRLTFTIGNGPIGGIASDWTYWADLRLENSR